MAGLKKKKQSRTGPACLARHRAAPQFRTVCRQVRANNEKQRGRRGNRRQDEKEVSRGREAKEGREEGEKRAVGRDRRDKINVKVAARL